jgi:hypothetical protein
MLYILVTAQHTQSSVRLQCTGWHKRPYRTCAHAPALMWLMMSLLSNKLMQIASSLYGPVATGSCEQL